MSEKLELNPDGYKWPVFDDDDDNNVVFRVKKDRQVEVCSSYQLSTADNASVSNWLKDHNPVCKYHDDGSTPSNPCGAIGGRLTYSFTPTGLGVIINVTCACGEKIDLTDVENW